MIMKMLIGLLKPRNKVMEKEGVRYVLEISDLSLQDTTQRLKQMVCMM